MKRRAVAMGVALLFGAPVAPALAQSDPLAPGRQHACALTPTGLTKCWSDNALGQLGDNTDGAARC